MSAVTTDLFDAQRHRSFSLLVHAGSKGGKTWLGYTAPKPLLVLDTEGGRSSRFIPPHVKLMTWDPFQYAPPTPSAAWDSCVVHVRDVATLEKVLEWLESGKHPFRSVSLDSIWELQQQYVTDSAGVRQMKVQDWGEVLRRLLAVVNRLRDLCIAPVNPISVLLVTTAEKVEDGMARPFLQGQLKTLIAYKFDVVGHLFRWTDPETFLTHRKLLIADDWATQSQLGLTTPVAVGEAVGGRLGSMTDPNITAMLDLIYGAAVETTAAPAATSAATAADGETDNG